MIQLFKVNSIKLSTNLLVISLTAVLHFLRSYKNIVLISLLILISNFSRAAIPLDTGDLPFIFKENKRVDKYNYISVPLDWENAGSGEIELAYKIYNPNDIEKPYLILIGGGPASPTLGGYDSFVSEYSKQYRVISFDQRGVGASSPIELKPEGSSFEEVLRLFGVHSIAQDTKALLEKILKSTDKYVLASHSFGGLVVYEGLTIPGFPRPDQILILNPPPLVSAGMQRFFNKRTEVQISMSNKLQEEDPILYKKLLQARTKFQKILAADNNHILLGNEFDMYFFYNNPAHINALSSIIDSFLKTKIKTPEQAQSILRSGTIFSDPLNYLLDWSWPKRLSQTNLVQRLHKKLQTAAEDWMLLESRVIMTPHLIDRLSEENQKVYSKIDSDLKKSKQVIDWKRVSEVTRDIPLLMVASDVDALAPASLINIDFNRVFAKDPLHKLLKLKNADHWFSLDGSGATEVLNAMSSQISILNGSPKQCMQIFLNN